MLDTGRLGEMDRMPCSMVLHLVWEAPGIGSLDWPGGWMLRGSRTWKAMLCAERNEHKEKRPVRRTPNDGCDPRLLPEIPGLSVGLVYPDKTHPRWVWYLWHRLPHIRPWWLKCPKKQKNPPPTMTQSTRHHFQHFTITQMIPVWAIFDMLFFFRDFPTIQAILKQLCALDCNLLTILR